MFQLQFWSHLFWQIKGYYVLTHTLAHKIVTEKKALHSQLKHLLTYFKFQKTPLASIS